MASAAAVKEAEWTEEGLNKLGFMQLKRMVPWCAAARKSRSEYHINMPNAPCSSNHAASRRLWALTRTPSSAFCSTV